MHNHAHAVVASSHLIDPLSKTHDHTWGARALSRPLPGTQSRVTKTACRVLLGNGSLGAEKAPRKGLWGLLGQ